MKNAHREPREYEAPLNQAIDLWHAGNSTEAIRILSELSVRYADQAPIEGMLSGYLHQSGEVQAALPHARNAVRLAPRSELAARVLFHTLYELNMLDEAREELSRFILNARTIELKHEFETILSDINEMHLDQEQ